MGKISGAFREGRRWKIPPDAAKLTDRLAYYDAFDEYYVKHNLSAMEKRFARYLEERLDAYLEMLKE